ncbi:MAG TPA: META domain-containing protein [Plantibacter sp.]|uniref:META domain-containing protein n=1 Tax=unclassified Plantibacter TaxID=2624265 RepID=UPI002CA1449D|nr:META domain-containing protein [Plantibacter sp.]
MFAVTRSGPARIAVLGTIGAGILTLVLAGCSGSSSAGDPSASTTPDAGASDAVGIVGVWGDADAQQEPSLTFAEDGSVSGSDGCNRLVASWTADGDTVDFAPLASTRMACEGVDTWLSNGASGTWTESTLVVLDETGTQIGTLERSE